MSGPDTRDTATEAPPARPVGLVRARLLTALDAHRSNRLGLVIAPAGSGKTTLLTQYARTFDGPVWWHAIEPGDASVTTFCRRLADTLDLPDAASVAGVDDLRHRLDSTPRTSGLLVVDDLHRVSQSSGETALGELLARSPAWLHVLVGSRSTPGFNLSQHELSDATLIDADQLRFRAWEVERLLCDVYGAPLPPDDAASLSRRVGGWAAGLHMFHLSTLGRPLAERRHALAALDGRSRRTRDYLAGTVLAELPPATRDFLMLTCVFDVLSAERCARLLRDRDAANVQRMLEDLERRQAFTISYDGGATFRYHEVLRAHLTVLLTDALGARSARAWYARAGHMLETDGRPSEAARAYARAEDWQAVRRLLARLGADVVAEDFTAWRDVLPAWLVAEDPWLVLAEGRFRLSRGEISRAIDQFRQAESLVNDETVRAHCRADRQRAAVWLPEGASETAPPLPVDHPLTRLRAVTRRPPASTGPRSRAVVRRLGDRSDVGLVGVPAVDGDRAIAALADIATTLVAGDLPAACRAADRAADRLVDTDTPGSLALRLVQATFRLATGEPDAPDRLTRVGLDAERAQATWLVRMARAAAALGGTEQGIKDAYTVAEDCDRDDDAWGALLASGAAAIGRLLIEDPDLPTLRTLVARARELDAGALAAWAQALAACAAVVTGDPDAPLDIAEAEQLARTATTLGAAAVAQLASAWRQGAPDLIDEAREAARHAGLPAAFIALLLGPATGRPVLPYVVNDQTFGSQTPNTQASGGHAPGDRASGDLPGETASGHRPSPVAQMDDDAETDASVASVIEPPIQVRCFGGFALELPGRTLDWSSVKPRTRMALRLLAMHGGRPVHREALAAALWPEMDQSSATRNLHVALSSLRTFLDPGMPRGQCTLIVRNGDAYELALPAGGQHDVVMFTDAVTAARRAELAGDRPAMTAALRRALLSYAGDLLPEDGPAEWVAGVRETYRQQAAGAAETLAAADLDAGDAGAALAAAQQCLAIDVYRDRGWRLLAEAHRMLGNVAAADRAMRDYAAVLTSLGLDPVSPAAAPAIAGPPANATAGANTTAGANATAGANTTAGAYTAGARTTTAVSSGQRTAPPPRPRNDPVPDRRPARPADAPPSRLARANAPHLRRAHETIRCQTVGRPDRRTHHRRGSRAHRDLPG